MTLMTAWRAVHPDLRSSRGFRWPFPGGEAVAPLPDGAEFTAGDPCPQFEGDGLCLAKTWAGAASGSPSHSPGARHDRRHANTGTHTGTLADRRPHRRRPDRQSDDVMSRRPIIDLICALIFAVVTATPAWWIYGPPAGVAVFAAAAALFLWVDT